MRQLHPSLRIQPALIATGSSWTREKTDCSFPNLCQGTKAIVAQMLMEKASGTIDEETGGRFKKGADYLMKNGAFEKPLIAIRLSMA